MTLFPLIVQFAEHCLASWPWMIPLFFSGFFLYKTAAAFLLLKPGRGWRALLLIVLSGVTGMVIWVGDNNLLFTFPVFFVVFLACSKGNRTGRLAVTVIFFCLILSVCALLDTYYAHFMHAIGRDSYSTPINLSGLYCAASFIGLFGIDCQEGCLIFPRSCGSWCCSWRLCR